MADNVPTNGFITPPNSSEQKPGFVQNPGNPAPPAQEVQEPPVAESKQPEAQGDLSAAIAALTAALGKQAAPDTEEKPADQVATPGAPTSGLNDLDVASIDDPILRSMATVMKTAGNGLDMDRVFGKALEHGDAGLLDVAYIREKAGANADQLITIAEGIVQAVEAKAEATTKAVYDLVGGEQSWNVGIAAFNSAAPRELRMVVANMLDSGKTEQITAGAKIIHEFAKTSGLVPQGKPLVQQGAAGMSSAQALSKDEFQEALKKLNPNAKTYQQERADLFARRSMGKQLGR